MPPTTPHRPRLTVCCPDDDSCPTIAKEREEASAADHFEPFGTTAPDCLSPTPYRLLPATCCRDVDSCFTRSSAAAQERGDGGIGGRSLRPAHGNSGDCDVPCRDSGLGVCGKERAHGGPSRCHLFIAFFVAVLPSREGNAYSRTRYGNVLAFCSGTLLHARKTGNKLEAFSLAWLCQTSPGRWNTVYCSVPSPVCGVFPTLHPIKISLVIVVDYCSANVCPPRLPLVPLFFPSCLVLKL